VSALESLKTFTRLALGNTLHWTGIVSLNYHRIGDEGGATFDPGLCSATPEQLDRQLRWLKANFDVVSPHDIPNILRIRRGRHVIVTFDDGYEDNYTVAFPLLRAHGVPATFFITTGFIDHPRLPWWDEIAWMVRSARTSTIVLPAHLPTPIPVDEPGRERVTMTLRQACFALQASPASGFLDALAEATGSGRYDARLAPRIWMTWDMIRELLAAGMTIGGHTIHHPVLARLPRDRQAEEIGGCGRRIQEELGVPMRTFAYPYGQPNCFNDDTRSCLEEVGVRTAFSYYGGFRRLDEWDDFDSRRIPVERHTSFDQFRAGILVPWIGRHVDRSGGLLATGEEARSCFRDP
jgi:peptidoglycan/xylan/chitin deacetylase (PgdA/CDA1 family)